MYARPEKGRVWRSAAGVDARPTRSALRLKPGRPIFPPPVDAHPRGLIGASEPDPTKLCAGCGSDVPGSPKHRLPRSSNRAGRSAAGSRGGSSCAGSFRRPDCNSARNTKSPVRAGCDTLARGIADPNSWIWHPQVVRAGQEAAREGTSFGTPNPREIRLAQLVRDAFPSMQKIRFVNSGTEATMSAIRLARGFTKRDKILKFEGCYHGHADALLVKAGSGGATFDVPDSAGVPADFARNTLTLPLNDFAALDTVNWREIACVIIEPVPANMGLIPDR